MCVAIPAQLTTRDGNRGTIDLSGSELEISLALVPEAQTGDWLLVHTGYALAVVTEAEAAETRALLNEVLGG
ncbi:MAG: HypC/HybG/HupF family hydrogenase formation chaperone [Candidatus Cloacimonetes bacterium]|nr:HypC/HybG/HupF family hydrogenase formation chaperone [Candidatus Cloacimonadota bacterium]